MSRNRAFWVDRLGEEWALKLKDTLRSEYMNKLMDFVNTRSSKGVVYPDKQDIFKAFKWTPFSKVRVVILGYSPYADGNDIGVAYGNKAENLYFSYELAVIFDKIEKEFYDGLHFDFDFTLESWAKQGVLLLNTSLTSEENIPGSHKKPWVDFTKAVLTAINEYSSGVIFMLWGEHAKKVGKFVGDNHYKLEFDHPTTVSHYGMREVWECPNFKEANEILINLNNEEIKW